MNSVSSTKKQGMSYAWLVNINPTHRYLKYENVIFEGYGSQASVHKA